MLRPEKMCRVSVTGSKRTMERTIEAVHDLEMLHVTEYDGSWEGFEPGNSLEGTNEVSDKLVTVRSLESILGVTEADAGPTRVVTDDAIEEQLETVRTEVNELDDRRDDIRDDLRAVEEQIDTMEPFVTLGIDLDLLRGYDSLAVAVGEGNSEEVEAALEASDIERFDLFSEDGVVAAFARTDESTLQDALVGATFSRLEVPDGEGDPTAYLEELEHQRQQLESKLTTVEDELDELRLDHAGFLLAAEEKLSIEAQKGEAPLTFATTENAFIAEGWIPNDRYAEFEQAVSSAVGDAIDIDRTEIAEYDGDGHAESSEEVEREGGDGDEPVDDAIDAPEPGSGGQPQETVADGGVVTMGGDPPVIQDNPAGVKPFESLVEVINRPKYSEFDPTIAFFLTFPAFFGFMIGDLGYGLIYMLLGYALYSRVDSDVVKSLGGVAMWAGGFTALFGVLYGEFFGLHQLGEIVWGGSPPIHKGLQPVYGEYALGWLVLSLFAGMLHLAVGWTFDFIENLSHGLKDAVLESGSWLLMLFGFWGWVLADAPPTGAAPALLVGSAEQSVFAGNPFALGFTGLPTAVGFLAFGLFALGLVLLVVGEPIEGVEFLNVLVNVLSYTRLAAVLLAKAGMAFVVNLLFFGAYSHDGEFHFLIDHGPQWAISEYGAEALMFPGLIHSGIAAALVGVLILVIGHLLVLVLGITSAGLQGVRLEYVEFFGKFYEGGGKPYNPFGYERTFTTED